MERKKPILAEDFKSPHQKFGSAGEQAVCAYLQQQGYQLLGQNFRRKQGEIDIIARRDKLITFVEVKSRATEYFPLSQIVLLSKQRRIIAAAKQFLLCHKLTENIIYRFDVALVIGQGDNMQIRYIPNAFSQQDYE